MSIQQGSLGDAIRSGRRPAQLVFSGQDPQWDTSLQRVLSAYPNVRGWASEVLRGFGERISAAPGASPALASAGVDPREWLEHPDEAFAAEVRASASYCLVGTSLGHLLACRAVVEAGALEGTAGLSGVIGHSVGLFSAWNVARHGLLVPVDTAADTLFALAVLGEMSARHSASLNLPEMAQVLDGDTSRCVMLSVGGCTERALEEYLSEHPTDSVEVALQNSWDRFVLGGTTGDMAVLAGLLQEEPGVEIEAVPSSVPFHHRLLDDCVAPATTWLEAHGVRFTGDLQLPLVDPRDGTLLSGGDQSTRLIESMLARPVRWADTIAGIVTPDHVMVDFGPSSLLSVLTRRVLRGTGATVVALGEDPTMRALTDADSMPRPTTKWSTFLPTLVADTDGDNATHRVVTRHTRRSHRSAFVLAGMNPTTVDAGIVVAAANAGHVAELGGGGQVSATIFTERMAELAESLTEGHEVTFNALNLDPYLWDLHIGRERIVQRAREAGAPICGVTVSAGIPETDAAVALIEELRDLGIWLNAFKPGTADQVQEVLEIADRIDGDLWLHLEGGRAGGHHSWVELEDLLFTTYAKIRERDNVVLCVGGGVGTPERAAELLGGTWALRHNAYRMPVDAVLLGTAAMACAESTASPSVKAALVAAPGTESLVRTGEWRGGVTSSRSSLGADIHCLDTYAAHVADLLDEVAGDPEAVAQRHDDIAEALAGTAKPWFGDLSTMTYLQMLERFVELCARGRHGRYEDGCWFDHTLRLRFLDLIHRTEARCCELDEGVTASLFSGPHDLDDPWKAIEALSARYPLADAREMEPTDVAHFVEVCDGPGKPVPFVAVIDSEVRRRYLVDSLWQAHSDLWSVDEVLVIPGPVALAGITRVDEPIAELLERFDREVARHLNDDPASAVAAPRSTSAIEVLLALPNVRSAEGWIRSPLRSLGEPGDWKVSVETEGFVATLDHGAERAEMRGPLSNEGTVEVRLTWPALTELPEDGVLEFTVHVATDHGVPWASIDEASIRSAQRRALDYVVDAAEPIAEATRSHSCVTPAPLVDAVAVPDASVRMLWPGLFSALRDDGAGDGLLQLVHARHRVRTTSAVGAQPLVRAEIIGHDHVPAGRRIHTSSVVGDTVVEDTFLLRGWHDESADPTGTEAVSTAGTSGDGPRWVDTERHHLARTSRLSPRHPEQFAMVSGDLNPIHRSDLLARFTGLPGRIVHGMWTSAAAQSFLVTDVLDGAANRLRDWEIDFVDMVLPGERVEMTATRVARGDDHRRVEVLVEGPRGIVARAFADVSALRTAYVFPGQGIQWKGMGMDGYERSMAARDVWDRAEAFTRGTLGFSLLDVVSNNPTRLRVGDEVHVHPEGVLNLTQFTQVAMATFAAAQVAELRAEGAFDETAVLAGHSIGEYNALAAIGGVLRFEATLGLVWARGTAMHHLVPRDDKGESKFRLGVIRPHLAGLGADEATALVEQVAAHTGELCEVVNHNLRGRQYAVAGTVGALEVLADRLGPGDASGRSPFLLVPGIDVPFHSSALIGGVEEFQAHLDAALPEEIDPGLLVGRYVPNLYPVPFRIDRDYVEAVTESCGGGPASALLERWEELQARPGRLTRELLVQLLAWQFASPVRWIEATEVMVAPEPSGGLGVRRVVEVGLGAAPTLTNLTSAALLADRRRDVAVLHVELHAAEVFDTAAEPEPVTKTDPATSTGSVLEVGAGSAPEVGPEQAVVPEQAQEAPPTVQVVPSAAQDVADLPVGTADALEILLAHAVQINVEQLGDDSVDLLVGGASSRRNQVMMDVGKEFGIGAVDGAHELGRHELAERLTELARTYTFPGPVLGAAMASGLAGTFGPLGMTPGAVGEHVSAVWGLGEGWSDRCRIELFLGTREAPSRRGGSLHTLEPSTDAVQLIDVALSAAAQRAGVSLHRPSAEAAGTTVDSVELDALMRRVDDAFTAGARAAAEALSQGAQGSAGPPVSSAQPESSEEASPDEIRATERLALLDLEHGVERAEAVEPTFDSDTIRWFASGTAWARADLDHLFHSSMLGSLEELEVDRLVRRLRCFSGTDRRFDDTLAWYLNIAASRPEVADVLARVASGPEPDDVDWMSAMGGRVVLVSGASPGSIAESTAARLLAAGATVILVTSSSDPQRRRAARALERDHGAPGAQLYFVRANLASFTDVERLCEWLDAPSAADGTPGPGLPDVVLPFAAPRVMGDVPDTGPSTEVDLRVLLLGVERLVGGLSERLGASPGDRKLTAVLPLSPNHGIFGGDGAYGASKAGLEVLISRRRSEQRRWGRHCRIVAAEIGWVRGTSLMAANDGLVPVVEQELGIRTWSAQEMGDAIARLCEAGDGLADVHRVDLTGGLGDLDDQGGLSELLRSGLSSPGTSSSRSLVTGDGDDEGDDRQMLSVLPTPGPAQPEVPWPLWPASPEVAAEDMVVICGVAEIGPWGTSTTRAEVELDGDLSARGVLELALRCGLVQWRGTGVGALVDVASGEVVPESEVAQRYRSAVVERCGIRTDRDPFLEGDAQVFTDRTLTLGVGSEQEARAVVDASPGASCHRDGDLWSVELPAGASIRLPRRVELPRRVTAPLPDGMGPECLGLPADLANTVDPLAAWNLAVSAEAFRDAGTDPDELLTVVHPASVADTQGCGMGGMESLRGLFIDPIRGVTHANDLLQEALPNVPAAHAMQSLLGGYGSMVHPVGACATAAVSLEVAMDLVRLNKADVVLAGGYDDLSHVGIIGFADMSATADDSEMSARGYEASEMSRPGDRSRAGFVESAGGGSLVVCRGSVALELGLPVRAVLAMASSHADGLQRSIPAPGLGALSVARGGADSHLARALRCHGLTADDIAVVSKHDTSTRANDPNEAAIHERVAELIGRSAGNPMRVVSQKSLTGHSKGGAAAWQVAGLCDVFDKATVPGNRNLDSVDPDVVQGPWLVVDDRPLHMHEPPKAALLTSLGFGHVSAVVLLVHPAAFHEALSPKRRATWRRSAERRRREAFRERRWQLIGGPPAFVSRDTRLHGGDDAARADSERLMLADPSARLGADGLFPATSAQENRQVVASAEPHR